MCVKKSFPSCITESKSFDNHVFWDIFDKYFNEHVKTLHSGLHFLGFLESFQNEQDTAFLPYYVTYFICSILRVSFCIINELFKKLVFLAQAIPFGSRLSLCQICCIEKIVNTSLWNSIFFIPLQNMQKWHSKLVDGKNVSLIRCIIILQIFCTPNHGRNCC